MTQSQETQLGVLRSQMEQNITDHKDIKDSLSKIEVKLDTVIKEKAEVTDLKTLDNRVWAIIISILLLLAGIIATWFKR